MSPTPNRTTIYLLHLLSQSAILSHLREKAYHWWWPTQNGKVQQCEFCIHRTAPSPHLLGWGGVWLPEKETAGGGGVSPLQVEEGGRKISSWRTASLLSVSALGMSRRCRSVGTDKSRESAQLASQCLCLSIRHQSGARDPLIQEHELM